MLRRLAVLLLPLALTGCPRTQGAAVEAGPSKSSRAVPVVVATAKKGDLKVYFSAPGAVTAFNTVAVRSRVDGELMNVAFTEGQIVREGDLLFEIDPRPFQVQLAQAQGQLAKDKAELENSKVNLARFLEAKDAISQQQIDTMNASVSQSEGTIKVDEAAIANAQLLLTYSKITSPITGRIGLRNVDKGNFVRASDSSPNGLAVITQLQPIAVIFSLPQDDLAAIGTRVDAGAKLPVECYDRELRKKLATGELLTFDNQIDPSTGTIRFKAVFENRDNVLFPNEFVNARLLVETKKDQVLVPSAAVQRSPRSTFVYVVKADDTVEMRDVTTGESEAEETVVTKGLAPGEVVVIEGVDKLLSGAKVLVPGKGEKGGEKPAEKTGEKPEKGEKHQKP